MLALRRRDEDQGCQADPPQNSARASAAIPLNSLVLVKSWGEGKTSHSYFELDWSILSAQRQGPAGKTSWEHWRAAAEGNPRLAQSLKISSLVQNHRRAAAGEQGHDHHSQAAP